MQLQAHFENIQQVILDHLQQAESEILVAVAWFTDRDIFNLLCQKAQSGVQVTLAVLGDEINLAPSGLNFNRLKNLGAKVNLLPVGSDRASIMHHKFCVVDQTTVITGSYNWSKRAQSNDENITVVTHAPEFAQQYRTAFYELLGTSPQAASSPVIDTEVVKRRLEMIRNLILLGEEEDLPPHIQKLQPVVSQLKLGELITTLEGGNYQQALEFIDAFIQRISALVVREDIDVAKLKFELQVLEIRLQSISDDKSDLERRLVVFNRRYNEALGRLFVRLLEARSVLASKKAAESRKKAAAEPEESQPELEEEAEQFEKEAQEAKQDWQDYQEEYEEQQALESPSRLTEEEEKELKKIYRQACGLCHPDRYAEEEKEAAHQAFIALQEVYNSNDLEALKEFHSNLKTGGLSHQAPRSSTLSQADSLRAAIAELNHRIKDELSQLQQLNVSEEVRLMGLAGISEEEWSRFFEQQKRLVEQELEQLQEQISAYDVLDIE